MLERILKILIYGLNYSPELTGIGKYTGEMATWLAKRGHDVRVVTAPPYYPGWKVQDGYRRFAYATERGLNVKSPTVYRCPLWVPALPSGLTRLIHLVSFALSSLPVMLSQSAWRPEIVFTIEPTFFAAPVGLFTAWLAHASSWLHVQDFEVDAAFDLGFFPANGRLHALALRFETLLTRRFTKVSSISERMIERIGDRRRADRAPILFPNWGDIEAIRPALPEAENLFREHYGLHGKTILLYSGNMGAKQGLEMLVPVVKALASDDKIHFIFCGDGPYRSRMEKMVAGLRNVTMLSLQPLSRLGELLNAADIHLLPQLPGAANLVMPSKLCDMMASGRPVIATADAGTQLAQVVEGCGLAVPTGDPEALLTAIQSLVYDADTRRRMGFRAREYAVQHLGKEKVLRRFERQMLSMLKPVRPQADVPLARISRG